MIMNKECAIKHAWETSQRHVKQSAQITADMISEDDFIEYEKVRLSGVTNMFAVNVVSNISGLSREQILCIMQNYSELKQKYISAVNAINKDELREDTEDGCKCVKASKQKASDGLICEKCGNKLSEDDFDVNVDKDSQNYTCPKCGYHHVAIESQKQKADISKDYDTAIEETIKKLKTGDSEESIRSWLRDVFEDYSDEDIDKVISAAQTEIESACKQTAKQKATIEPKIKAVIQKIIDDEIIVDLSVADAEALYNTIRVRVMGSDTSLEDRKEIYQMITDSVEALRKKYGKASKNTATLGKPLFKIGDIVNIDENPINDDIEGEILEVRDDGFVFAYLLNGKPSAEKNWYREDELSKDSLAQHGIKEHASNESVRLRKEWKEYIAIKNDAIEIRDKCGDIDMTSLNAFISEIGQIISKLEAQFVEIEQKEKSSKQTAANWKQTVDIKALMREFKDDDSNFEEIKNKIANMLNTVSTEKFTDEYNINTWKQVVTKLKNAIDTDEFNSTLEEIYDIADDELVWLGL